MEVQRLDFADAMRGIAILAIMILHAGADFLPTTAPKVITNLTIAGRFGVQIFFIISAFTIYYALTYNHRDGEGWLQFFQRRFFRIAPLFYVAIVVYSALTIINIFPIMGGGDATAFNIFAHFTFIFALIPSLFNTLVPGCWTVANEILFYATIPVLFTVIKKLQTSVLLLIGGGIIGTLTWIYASALVLTGQLDQNYIYWWFPNQFAVFCLGIVMFFLLKKSLFEDGWLTKLAKPQKQLMSVTCISVAFIIGYFISNRVSTPMGQYILSTSFILIAIGLAVYPFKVIVNKYSIYLGKISYSCYIIHFAVISALYQILQLFISASDFKQLSEVYAIPVFLILFSITLIITITISGYTYKYIEVPGIALGKRLMKK